MPSKLATPGTSQNYQRFAWGTLALAGLVALFSADRSEPASGEAAFSAPLAVDPPVAAKMARPAFTPVQTAPLADIEAAPEGDAAPAEDAEEQPAAGAGPGSDPALASAQAKAPGAGSSATAQTGQLMASSHARSGSAGQGDDPRLGQSN